MHTIPFGFPASAKSCSNSSSPISFHCGGDGLIDNRSVIEGSVTTYCTNGSATASGKET